MLVGPIVPPRGMGPAASSHLPAPVPTEDGVRGNERSNLREGASANGLTSHGQSAALIVGQPESPTTEPLFQDTILLAEILDDRILLAADPGGHPGVVACEESMRYCLSFN